MKKLKWVEWQEDDRDGAVVSCGLSERRMIRIESGKIQGQRIQAEARGSSEPRSRRRPGSW